MELRAVLFDVGGTIAESEEIHRLSFNEAFKEFGLSWYWDEAIYRELVFVGGGKERIKHYIQRAWPEMLKQKDLTKYILSIHKIKSQIYEELLNDSELKPRPGILRLLEELKRSKIRLAVVSDTTEDNLKSLFRKGLNIDPNQWFEVIAHGGCSDLKKPSPDVYLWALEELKLPPQSCIAIEDAPRGVKSAVSAGLNVIVTPSMYTMVENFQKSLLVVSDLGEPKEPFKVLEGNVFDHKMVDLRLLKKIHQNFNKK